MSTTLKSSITVEQTIFNSFFHVYITTLVNTFGLPSTCQSCHTGRHCFLSEIVLLRPGIALLHSAALLADFHLRPSPLLSWLSLPKTVLLNNETTHNEYSIQAENWCNHTPFVYKLHEFSKKPT